MTHKPLELHSDLDESLVEFWHGGETRPFATVYADELRVYEEFVEVYSRDYDVPILIVREYAYCRW